eukprot:scaffold82582_cov32-Tisochrysis_lutea.AAC.1
MGSERRVARGWGCERRPERDSSGAKSMSWPGGDGVWVGEGGGESGCSLSCSIRWRPQQA